MARSNRKFFSLFIIILVFSFGATWMFLNVPREETYSVQNSFLSYTNRPQVEYGQEVWNETGDRIIYKVWFPSHGDATIYGLLAVPKLDGPLPAFFILPGASVTKEGVHGRLGNALNDLGYVTLSLDQRSHGETLEKGNGVIPPFDQDYYFGMAQGYEAVHHMMVYDGLRAFDLLNQLPGIDRSRIYAAGESMGGNYAIIASATEPRVSGLMLVSSSGYRFLPQNDPGFAGYLVSISGLNYIDRLSPRPLLMLQAENDKVVPLKDAYETFGLAGEPKTFLTINSTLHSYGGEMRDILVQGLEGW